MACVVFLRRLLIATGVFFLITTSLANAQERFSVRSVSVPDTKAVWATVEALDQTAARARIGGTVTELSVDEGSAVTAGQIVARVVDPKLQIRERAINERLAALVSRQNLAETELVRARKLQRSGTISQQRLDQVITDLDVVSSELTSMRAEQAVIAEQRKEGVVRAPISGRVLATEVTLGKVVLPGEVIARIASATYILRLYLPERHARFLTIGDIVSVGARGMADSDAAPRPGTVRQVYPELNQGRVVADVTVDGLGNYFVGERVQVHVSTGERTTYIVPADFLSRRHGLSFARLENGEEIVVQPGPARRDGIEILSGLRTGDVLLKTIAQE